MKVTNFASGFTLPLRSRSESFTPRQSACPTAPLSHCAPATRGRKSARPLPAHCKTEGFAVLPIFFSSESVSESGFSTAPSRVNLQEERSIAGGPKWLRTKNTSLGVNSPLKAETCVSRSCGRLLRTMNCARAARGARRAIRKSSRRITGAWEQSRSAASRRSAPSRLRRRRLFLLAADQVVRPGDEDAQELE